MAYTTIDDPSAYFQIALYTGNAGTNNIVNDGNSDLQPDWVWIKNRSTGGKDHGLFDSSRGTTKQLNSNNTNAENTVSTSLTAFNSDGFTLGADGGPNASSDSHVAWQWKANGGTTTTNDASATGVGNQDSTHQVNTTSGFSIVTYNGVSQLGTMAHGLGAVPHVMIVKCRSDVEPWEIYHHKNTSAPETEYIRFNSTNGTADSAHIWNDTAPTSSIFTVGNTGSGNENSKTYVAYLFTEIQGYSKFGSYVGNGDADGPFIYLGFKPKYFLLKNATASSGSGGQHWQISDTERHPANPLDLTLFAEDNAAEGGTWSIKDFVSNGVKIRGNNYAMNTDGDSYIYMAFAEHPFVSSEGVPTTAR